MIRFILNNKLIHTDDPPGTLLVDFIRYGEYLTGTKIGCREGDCGACTVLIGELRRGETGGLKGDRVVYRSVTSCLTALGNVHQKHVVTIEGLNGEELNFLQRMIVEEGGTQCGFCTPGFIVSMAGFCLSDKAPTPARALAEVDGNICRCTGYKSIERALARVVGLLEERGRVNTVDFSVDKGIVPAWFAAIPGRLAELALQPNGVLHEGRKARFLGGGTDLYVQQPEAMVGADLEFLGVREDMKGIGESAGTCVIGGAVTISDMMESPVICGAFPHFDDYVRLIASTPIRNIATVAGNFVNASPIGDISIFFLALDAQLTLSNGLSRRELPLRKFYAGYKLLNKEPDEFIEKISFNKPGRDELFHFEKVSKRTNLDIASVNTAIRVKLSAGKIVAGHISAGGVGPVPAWLEGASAVMSGRRPDVGLLEEVVEAAQTEVSPISDVRGTADYKRQLLGQLIKAHFLTFFPGLPVEEIL
jgi:xanthine dehydrogenase small subunit